MGPDLVVVMIHWGPNWRWQPSKQLRQLGKAFLDAGADLVFGTSPHHIQVPYSHVLWAVFQTRLAPKLKL